MKIFFMQLLIVAIISVCIIKFFQSKVPTIKGYLGEIWIRLFLRKLNSTEYKVFHNVLLPIENNKTTQIDHIIISIYGIFVIETKNYKGWIFGHEHKKHWTQVIFRHKQNFLNPIYQNYGHIQSVKTIFDENYNGPYYSIITFSTSATLKEIEIFSSDISVVYNTEILKEINRFQEPKISKEELNNLTTLLEKTMIKGRDSHKQHVKSVKQSQLEKKQKEFLNLCPKCGGQLRERKGKFGVFKGCSNYPKCRYTA
ncbi:NERD domain-containing protein [Alkalihalobacillus sp. AL-G]|uniref:NERD domain-containing protein n=1 Tax=Alkalihalobacillus sp. AL-G TaxID=2926399 RepID=UPI00272CFB60|nr:NERD domain-containing protein [Alkalihalobacillus sp. AL-G]WLD94467.1 NERD domain-containing protein [Alkalihalobacillus sp. AL-G]